MSDSPQTPYPRDMIGYGRDVPNAQWPGGAKVAVQFVLNGLALTPLLRR